MIRKCRSRSAFSKAIRLSSMVIVRTPRLVFGALNVKPALVSSRALSILSVFSTGSTSVQRSARISLRRAPVDAATATIG